MYESYYQTYANAAATAAAAKLELLPNVFEPIVNAGELESMADYQLHYLAQADFLASNEESQCGQPRAPPTKEARAERNLHFLIENMVIRLANH